MESAISMISYGIVLIFGVAVSATFSGIEFTKKNTIKITFLCALLLIIQTLSYNVFGLEITKQLYPLITHLPLMLFLCFVMKRKMIVSFVCVLSAYMCCQIPKWISIILSNIITNNTVNELIYIVLIFISYFILYFFVRNAMQLFMTQSKKFVFFLGFVPLLYYLFDYATTIYTDILFRGVNGAVQFMPSVISVMYFVFIIIYNFETQKQEKIIRERDIMLMQLRQAKTEFETIRQLQNQTKQYRHDMRHHFSLLQGFTNSGDYGKVKEYLNNVVNDIEAITPNVFCENEAVNILLSHFKKSAEKCDIEFTIQADVPKDIPLSDTELCSIVSNGLENAIIAASDVKESSRHIDFKIKTFNDNLLIQIQNTFNGNIKFRETIPFTVNPGHGYGTQSIVSIVNSNGGQYSFNANDNLFTLRIIIPYK